MLLTLSVHTAHATGPGKVFRWKLKPGETLNYRVVEDIVQNVREGAAKGPQVLSTKLTMDMVWKVDSVDDHGLITLDELIQRMVLKTQSAQGVLLEYDSRKAPEGMAKMVAPILEAMLQKPFRVTMTPQGGQKKVKFPPGMLETFSKLIGVQLGNLLSEDSMEQMGTMSVFPEGPIAPGHSWTEAKNIKIPFLGDQSVTTTFRYLGTEARDGRTLDKTDVTMTMKPERKKQEGEKKEAVKDTAPKPECEKKEGEKKQGEKKEVASGLTVTEGKGVLLFDNDAGRLVETTIKMKMKLDMNILGRAIVMDMDVNVHVGLEPAKAGAAPAAKEK